MKYMETEEVQKIGTAIGLQGNFLINWGVDDIINILCHEPETEIVEVTRYIGIKQDGETTSVFCTIPETWNTDWKLVELSGTYEKPVKPKVKRREELTLSATVEDNIRYYHSIPDSSSYKIYTEWEE